MPTSDGIVLPAVDPGCPAEMAAPAAIQAMPTDDRRTAQRLDWTSMPDVLCTVAAFAVVLAVVFGAGLSGNAADGGLISAPGQRAALLSR